MLCSICKTEYEVTDRERDLRARLHYEPSGCIQCRVKARLPFWPFGRFYSRKCALTNEPIITTFPPFTKFPVYKRSAWYGDSWQPPEMNINLNRSFFEQLKELQNKTPHFHMLGDEKSTNCDYCDDVWECRNCYLSRSLAECDGLFYSYRNVKCRNCFEITFCFDMEESFDCVYCYNCYGTRSAIHSRQCLESAFIYDCRNCTDCFMCWNLRNAEYHILNKKYSKDEYAMKVKALMTGSYADFIKLKNEFVLHLKRDAVHRPDLNVQTENSTGNFLDKCKDCESGFLTQETENCVGVFRGLGIKDCMDVSGLLHGELAAGIMQATDLYNVQFSFYTFNCSNSQYIESCFDVEDCFGCIGLRKKKNCILNKQYSPEAFVALKEKIIAGMKERDEYGQFFPPQFAYNGYNASLADLYFPQEEVAARALGFSWEVDEPSDVPTQTASTIPDRLSDATDDITQKAFSCEESGRPFKFSAQELAFHRRYNLPLSHLHPDVRTRHTYRFMTATAPQAGSCFECKKAIVHYYPPDWGFEKILCATCYAKAVG